MVIFQGDQYSIPIKISHRGETITPNSVDDVVIAIGDIVRSYRENTLFYEDDKWLFPIYKEETMRLPENTTYQVELHYGSDIVHSRDYPVKRKAILEALKARLRNV